MDIRYCADDPVDEGTEDEDPFETEDPEIPLVDEKDAELPPELEKDEEEDDTEEEEDPFEIDEDEEA